MVFLCVVYFKMIIEFIRGNDYIWAATSWLRRTLHAIVWNLLPFQCCLQFPKMVNFWSQNGHLNCGAEWLFWWFDTWQFIASQELFLADLALKFSLSRMKLIPMLCKSRGAQKSFRALIALEEFCARVYIVVQISIALIMALFNQICLNDALGFSTNFPVRSSSKRWWILRHQQVLNLSSTKRNIFINLSLILNAG